MACSLLLVSGLDFKGWSQAQDVMTSHGHSDQLRVGVEPEWQASGRTQAIAEAYLIQLVERLGCRAKLGPLPQFAELCLAHSATTILEATEVLGGAKGVLALAATDQDAAVCLCLGLMQAMQNGVYTWVTDDVRRRVDHTFAWLAPQLLPLAAAEVAERGPKCAQRAYFASRLTEVLLQTCESEQPLDEQRGRPAAGMVASVREKLAPHCMTLQRAIVDALSDWSAAVGRALQQQQQLPDGQQQPESLISLIPELRWLGMWLPRASASLLYAMREHRLSSRIDPQLLLDTLGQLVRKVVVFMQLNERAAVGGLWTLEGLGTPAVAWFAELHVTMMDVSATLGRAPQTAAGVSALHRAISKALGSALDHLTAPRHLVVLLNLSQAAYATLTVSSTWGKDAGTFMSQQARMQQLAAGCLSVPPQELPSRSSPEALLLPDELFPFADKVCCVLSSGIAVAYLQDRPPRLATATYLESTVLLLMLQKFLLSTQFFPEIDTDCIFNSAAVNALVATLQMAHCRNVRALSDGLAKEDASSCLAPGLFEAVGALLSAAEAAEAAAAAGQPWAGGHVAVLVRGSLGAFRLAHAEAAAREALTCPAADSTQLDPCMPHKARFSAADILGRITGGLTSSVARTLAEQGLVAPLLQALPWQATSSEPPSDMASWLTTEDGIAASCKLLAAALAADASARTAVLQDGSWDAAVQRVRDLQPPPRVCQGWQEQREALLRMVTTVLAGNGEGSQRTTGNAAPADNAEAVAAAERAMQELLVCSEAEAKDGHCRCLLVFGHIDREAVRALQLAGMQAEEQRADLPGQRSKAASKRVRKKAAKQQAVAIGDVVAPAHTAAQAPATSGSSQPADISCSSAPVAGALQTETPPAIQAPANSNTDSPGAGDMLQRLGTDTTHPAEKSDWWRCPLSGRVMHDPVLYGSLGHSFEREALEQWLAANPGVDPVTQEVLLPGASGVLPNHALRNMVQQLRLG